MSDQRQQQLPRFAWHELLEPIAPPDPEPREAAFLFAKGKRLHYKLEAIVGQFELTEHEGVYRDPDLPFEISYHPDITRQEVGVDGSIKTYLYEIKSLLWFLKNRVYCAAQASGYAHFEGAADVLFILYWRVRRDSPDEDNLSLSVLKLDRIPWPELKQLAKRAYAERGGGGFPT
jgi:hypothetical protein